MSNSEAGREKEENSDLNHILDTMSYIQEIYKKRNQTLSKISAEKILAIHNIIKSTNTYLKIKNLASIPSLIV